MLLSVHRARVYLECYSKHDNKLHIETCCDFFIKYLYMKGNSKKQRVSFPGRFLLRNEKMLVYGLKNRGRLINGIDLYSGKYGIQFFFSLY